MPRGSSGPTSCLDEVIHSHPWILQSPLGQPTHVPPLQQATQLQCGFLQAWGGGHTHTHTLEASQREAGYLEWDHVTLVQVQEKVEVGHCEGEIPGGLVVVVCCQLVEVLGGGVG